MFSEEASGERVPGASAPSSSEYSVTTTAVSTAEPDDSSSTTSLTSMWRSLRRPLYAGALPKAMALMPDHRCPSPKKLPRTRIAMTG